MSNVSKLHKQTPYQRHKQKAWRNEDSGFRYLGLKIFNSGTRYLGLMICSLQVRMEKTHVRARTASGTDTTTRTCIQVCMCSRMHVNVHWSIGACQCDIKACQCASMHVNVCECMSMCVNACQCMPLFCTVHLGKGRPSPEAKTRNPQSPKRNS